MRRPWRRRGIYPAPADPHPSRNALRELDTVRRELRRQVEAVRIVLLEEASESGRGPKA